MPGILDEMYDNPSWLVVGGEIMVAIYAHISPKLDKATYIVKRRGGRKYQSLEIEAI